MRKIDAEKIRKAVSGLCVEANTNLRKDVLSALRRAYRSEKNKRAKGILKEIIQNACIAKKEKLPICQDTGMAVVYCDIGQGVSVTGKDLEEAVNTGVREGYRKGYLRKSVVRCPVLRDNTHTNTPAVIHTRIVPGDRLRIMVCPKGFGSENKSRIKMFYPTAPLREIKEFVTGVIKECGAEACPPFVVGIGMGGTFEKAAELSELALTRPLNRKNPERHIGKLEQDLLKQINSLNIGPMGLGGGTTALGVKVITFATHIAGLPVAVAVSCHATRGASKVL